jgi:TolB protein
LYDDPSGGPDSRLHVLTLGGGLHPRDGGLGPGLEPTWSPDGSRIAFGATRATPNTNIYVADRDGGNVHVLTHFRHGATQPAWSPDGRTIAFEGEGGIGLVPAAGGEVRSLFSRGVEPSWSPNGRQLVFASSLGGQHEALFTIRPDGGGLRRITKLPGGQRSPTWSPDSRYLLVMDQNGAPTGTLVSVIDVTSGRITTVGTLPGYAADPSWSR